MVVSISVGLVKRAINAYTGYVELRRKEDDLAVKKHILNEVDKARNHLRNIQEQTYRAKKTDGATASKRVLDELDVFANEVDFSEAGHRYGFFSKHQGTSLHQIAKLIDHDKSLIEQMATVTEASKAIENAVLDGDAVDLNRELGKIRQHVSSARNAYKDRLEFIKKI